MDSLIGNIYFRNHESYEKFNACKMGKAANIPERDTQYATGEINRGYFEVVFQVPIGKMSIIERLLQNNFKEFNIKYNAGTEFYDKKIINLIEPFLQNLGIKYKKLSKEEISNLVRPFRVKNTMKKINIQSLITTLKSIKYIPREKQYIIIENAVKHFQSNSKGTLILPCGVGKTLISLWTTIKLNLDTILIGVPNTLLLQQWEDKVKDLFEGIPILIVSKGIFESSIEEFLKSNKKYIVITTYASSHKVNKATKNLSFTFGMKINDECHHLTSSNMELAHTTKKYIEMLKIKSDKQLSLTATIKQLESPDINSVSNDDIKHFGEVIDKKSMLWAINEKIICDYSIQTIITNEIDISIEENDKRLFLSAFASLKSLSEGHTHHLLIYSNNKENSSKIVKFIKQLLDEKYFNLPGLYYSDYHSDMKTKDQVKILKKFDKAKLAIITCVYCLGEGWDFPKLDGVVFAENMSSNIRIVQSALRASRKNKDEPNKLTKIILPVLNKNDWLDNSENSDLRKVKEVIYQMGLEDETITEKIKVFKINIEKEESEESKKEEVSDELGEYDSELTEKLRLKTINRNSLMITYEKALKILAERDIKSKEAYYELCKKDYRLPTEPEIAFKGKFTNWIDYLGIKRVYYDLVTCKNKVNEYLQKYPKLQNYYNNLALLITELCKIDPLFPPNGLWLDYYNKIDFQDIIINKNKKRSSDICIK